MKRSLAPDCLQFFISSSSCLKIVCCAKHAGKIYVAIVSDIIIVILIHALLLVLLLLFRVLRVLAVVVVVL